MRREWTIAMLLLAWSNLASAAVIVSNAGTFKESPGVWDWFYQVSLQPDQVLRPNDFFTLYDVPNILAGPGSVIFAPVSGSFTTTISGTTPPDPFGAVTNDDPAVNNIKVALNAGQSSITPGTGAVILGTLAIKSSAGVPLQTNYAAQAGLNNNDSTSVGLIQVADTVSAGVIPEPSSVTLMALGLAALGAVALRRRID